MTSSWQSETGDLALQWAEVAQRDQYRPLWILQSSHAQGGHISTLKDFSSHNPFG
jgi:hypothetical protein